MSVEHSEDFATYRSFDQAGVARILTDLLDENDVPYLVENNNQQVPDIILGDVGSSVEVKIKSEDFGRVDKLVEEKANKELDTVDPSYFIFDFNNDELYDVLVKPHEWSPLDVALAGKLLNDRGVDVDKDEIKLKRTEEVQASATPVSAKTSSLAILYVLLLIFPFISMIGGAVYIWGKKIDLQGNRVPLYDDQSKKHGKILFGVGFIFSIILVRLLIF